MDDSTSINIMKSMNGGINWIKKDSYQRRIDFGFFGARRRDVIYFSSKNIGYVIGDRGGSLLLRSINGGENWEINFLSYPFLDVYFLDKDNGYASGGYGFRHSVERGDIFVTDDGGKTWNLNFCATGTVFSSFFVNEYTGFAIASDGQSYRTWIYKTVNRGNSWSNVNYSEADSTDFIYEGSAIYFINELIGWVAGCYYSIEDESESAALFGTNDGGESWEIVWKLPNTDESWYWLNSIHVINSTVWAVGKSGLIVTSVSPDSFRVVNANTDLPLNKVFFSDEQHGWITGGYLNDQDFQSILLKTNNWGQAWDELRFDKYLINDIYFLDSLHGWVVGSDTSDTGMILETINGGDNWVVQVEGLSAPLNALHFKDGYGWVVGGNGLVLRTEDGSTWIDEKNDKVYPDKFSLSQNYPNPFNPKTVIRYTVGAHHDAPLHVELAIYNLLGQKVATLVSKKQQAGNYNVQWDATGFVSGVYLYRLVTDKGYENVKKLVLLK